MTKTKDAKKGLKSRILSVVVSILTIGIITASIMSISIQKATLYSITEINTRRTANIILRNLETAMIEARKDIIMKVIEGATGTEGMESIDIVDSDGRPAFRNNAAGSEDAAIKELTSGKEHLVVREPKRFIYYLALRNTQACHSCHDKNKPVLGAVRIAVNIENEYKKAMSLITLVIIITVCATISFSLILWFMLRKMVIRPVQSIEAAAIKIAEGDLTFKIDSAADDEIGRASQLLGESFQSFEKILLRIRSLSLQILSVVKEVDKQIQEVLRGANKEAEATESISAAIKDMNATTFLIAAKTHDLAGSAERSSGSIEHMVQNISEINESMQQLGGVVDTTSIAIERISETVMELSNRSTDLYGASEETSAAISEIAQASKDIEIESRESAIISAQVTTEAGALGMSSISRTLHGMKEIDSSVKLTAQRIEALLTRSREIEKVLHVIQDVNSEINLLSLNAAILSSQAGIHGKGFSVVAFEMKELSDRTEMSTREIAALIHDIQEDVRNANLSMKNGINAVDEGMKLAHDTEKAFSTVLSSSTRSSEMTLSIKKSAENQTAAAERVLETTRRVQEMVGIIVQAILDQAEAVSRLNDASGHLKTLSGEVSRATNEQASSSSEITRTTRFVSESSQEISQSLTEHKKGTERIYQSIELVKDIPVESRDLAMLVVSTINNLNKDAELLLEEIKRFHFSSDKAK